MPKILWGCMFLFAAAAHASVVVPSLVFEYRNLKVCQVDPADWIQAQEAFDRFIAFRVAPLRIINAREWYERLAQTIRTEFQEHTTGISFEFQKDPCEFAYVEGAVPRLMVADLGVVFESIVDPSATSPTGLASLGAGNWDLNHEHQFIPLFRGMEAPLVRFKVPNPDSAKEIARGLDPELHIRVDQLFAQVALHEFGHVAGLVHEQELFLEDAILDDQCKTSGWDSALTRFKASEEIPIQMLKSAYGILKDNTPRPYDPNSIMNDCFLDSVRRIGTGSVSVLKQSYGAGFRRYSSDSELRSTVVPTDPFVVFKSGPFPHTGKDERYELQIRIGLSAQDRESLREGYPAR
jgi:hypothetical protein